MFTSKIWWILPAQVRQVSTRNKHKQDNIISGLGSEGNTAPFVIGMKKWQQSITTNLRKILIFKLMYTIFPVSDEQIMKNRSIHKLITYATNVERNIYWIANTRFEYYHLLAEKIHGIRMMLKEKRRKWKKQQRKRRLTQLLRRGVEVICPILQKNHYYRF
ncbi:hypothetical protein ABEB36_010433 [Hypothenemus hampei]|uniref:histone acetyltransferase n=1 Tax=Hypothenemus hampei TaxID=57062 RepID=A0ABD1EJQ0_HYPHA